MTARECMELIRARSEEYQRVINAFVDEFRRADGATKGRLVEEPVGSPGRFEGLLAGVVSALCREASIGPPAWVSSVYSPEPFFPFPAKSFALRVRLMLESPAPFRIRNVFVPENYLSRA